ncbi:MAG: InlB B-repeat-containing protein [Bacilli bacterium]|nr:InlB B-repeat-containing protein [Bacilli bacterium]
MKKKIKLFLPVILLFLLVLIGLLNIKTNKINIIINEKDYSYLPSQAKDYIKDVYDKSGVIIRTEKNKVKNKSYLNPSYVEYLSLSNEEKQKVSIIPMPYTIDYVSSSNNTQQGSSELPSSYDLRNINGESYISPLKNQGDYGLCWAFTTLEQIESLLMVQNNTPYNDNIQTYSERQFHYATTKDYINNYDNKSNAYSRFDIHNVGSNYDVSSYALINGITIVNSEKMPYNTPVEKKNLYEVLNYSNSQYEANSTIYISALNEEIPNETRRMYINEIKKAISTYGGAYVGTKPADSNCGSKNSDGDYIINVDNCSNYSFGGHAMQAIGWDDNYEYSYCYVNGEHKSPNIDGTCSKGNLVSGKGAWILRNSYGDDPNYEYKYVYLAYDTLKSDFGITTSLSPMHNRNWDNNYHTDISADKVPTTNETIIFNKSINTDEKLTKVKFKTVGYNGSFSIYYSDEEFNNFEKLGDIETDLPGFYTMNVSDILLSNNSLFIKIESNNDVEFDPSEVSIFTINVDKKPVISTRKITTQTKNISIYSSTKNIDSNELIQYELYKKNIDYSDKIQIKNNIVAHNDVNTDIILSDDLLYGEYTLKTKYGGFEFDSIIDYKPEVNKMISFQGDHDAGTMEDFYFLYSETKKLPKNTFTREGYVFKGWNTELDGTGKFYSDEDIIDENDFNEKYNYLYAQWEEIDYNITFNSNGGTGNMEPLCILSTETKALSKNTFTKEGYKFIGWNTKADGSGTSYNDEEIISINNDITLYAQWVKISQIVFDANGGSGAMEKFIILTTETSSLPKNRFTRTGYKFIGWNTAVDGTSTSYNDEEIISIDNDITLYAQWEPIIYEVMFKSGYYVDGAMEANIQEFSYDERKSLRKNTITRIGYKFIGWNTKIDGTGIIYKDEEEVINLSSTNNNYFYLYAQWEKEEYVITIYKNDGTDEKVEQHYDYNDEYQFYNAFSREKYNLLYWEDIDTGDKYYNDDSIVITSNKKFNAIWDKFLFDVTFDIDGTGVNNTSITIQKNEKVFLPSNTNDNFVGWKDKDTNIVYTPNQEITAEKDMYFVGVWQTSNEGYLIKKYDVDETNKYISRIIPGTTIDSYKTNIELDTNHSVIVNSKNVNNKELLYTGSKTKIYKNGTKVTEYTNVVIGDLNGDGEINSADLLKMRQHLLRINTLNGIYFLSADINYDNEINSADLLRIRQHLLDVKTIG